LIGEKRNERLDYKKIDESKRGHIDPNEHASSQKEARIL